MNEAQREAFMGWLNSGIKIHEGFLEQHEREGQSQFGESRDYVLGYWDALKLVRKYVMENA